MDNNTDNATKQTWTSPKIEILGSVEKMTKQDKTIGGNDGIFLLGVGVIGNAGS